MISPAKRERDTLVDVLQRGMCKLCEGCADSTKGPGLCDFHQDVVRLFCAKLKNMQPTELARVTGIRAVDRLLTLLAILALAGSDKETQ